MKYPGKVKSVSLIMLLVVVLMSWSTTRRTTTCSTSRLLGCLDRVTTRMSSRALLWRVTIAVEVSVVKVLNNLRRQRCMEMSVEKTMRCSITGRRTRLAEVKLEELEDGDEGGTHRREYDE